MKRLLGLIVVMGLISFGGTTLAFAQAEAKPDEKTAIAQNNRAFFLDDLKETQEKVVSLADAFPADKYTWRPGAGVRSVSEVFLHFASANYGFPTFWGAAPPTGIERKGFEQSTTDKSKIIEQVKQSFEHMRQAVEKLSDADMNRSMKFFGGPAPLSKVLFGIANHTHEHLGQAIAYARMNGVVPPWTAARQTKQQQQKPKE
jgi:uncharacterized damage-inducible protein DinB